MGILLNWYSIIPFHADLNNPWITVAPSSVPAYLNPQLLTPKAGDTLVGPLVIKGYVPKSWTFEGQFRMQLLDSSRRIIIEDRVPVEWDSENRKETLYFVESYNYHTQAKSGFLILQNDNPSGLPENEKSVEVSVSFSQTSPGTAYVFDLLSENAPIDSQCQVVLPRIVDIGTTKTPIRDTLNLIWMFQDPMSGLTIKSVNLKGSTLYVEIPEVPGTTSGGACQQGINRLMLEKTALQFPQVKQVKFIPDNLFQP